MNPQLFGKKGWTPSRIASLTGKTFLITGTTSGTGFEATKILLSKGAKVVMLNRNSKKSEATLALLKKELGKGIDASFIPMDLAEQASVKKAAEQVLATVSQIDALICNAAIAQVPKQKITVDGFESQLGVNHYGHFTLKALLFPLIKKSKGRIVAIGSMGYALGLKTIQFEDMNWTNNYNPNGVYSQSKLAQMMCIYELQDRLEEVQITEVKAYACHPGASRTALIRTSGSLLTRFIWQIMKLTPLVQSAEKGAYPALMCATEADLDQKGFYGPTGKAYFKGPVGACKLEPHAKDKAVAKQLWKVSEDAVGLDWKF